MATDSKSKTETAVTKTNGNDGALTLPGSSVLVGDDGKTVVHNQVVAKIAGLAVQEIEGVQRLVPYGPGQTVSSFAKTITRSSMHELGVNVEVGQKEAAVDVRIITSYGASIPAVADGIRRNVSDRIEQMTGLQVVEVNIDVVDLYFPEADDDEPAPPPAATGRVQ
ncbi:Asp23/Gls24 family envelope stress response protein [Rubrivirga sp.]|uniref:Asp23/Gls24 family envelope stress response protein n=1 Tax=Rubrivirga sp. TaxID=1885344 RepID=UPI003B519C3F